MILKRDVYRLRYSRLWASLSAISIAAIPIFFFCTILQDNNIREKILTKFQADIHRYSIDEEVVADEIRRIQRQFLSFAGLVPYARRLKRIDSICHRDRELITSGQSSQNGFSLFNVPREAMRNIIVDDTSRILYCSVPGVASSSFRRLFYEQGGAGIPLKKESKHLENFKRLHQYPAAQRQYMIRNFFKLMVVRDPFTRLISIFRERFNSQNRAQFENFQGRYQREVDKYTQEDKNQIVEPHFNTSFSAFVRFLANNPDEHNSAWDPIFEMCHPCYIRYNYIAKQENLEEEIQAFLETINVQTLPKLMMGNLTDELVDEYMKQIGPWNIKTLARKYIYDFELYNYPLSKYLPMKSTDPLSD